MAETLSHPHGSPAQAVPISTESDEQGLKNLLSRFATIIALPLLVICAARYILLPSVKEAIAGSMSTPAQYALSQDGTTLVIARLPFTGSFLAHSDFRSVSLVGADELLKETVDQNRAKLEGVAITTLQGLSVSDLDKPGALDLVRTQLVVGFNQALGKSEVKEVYLTVKSP